MKQRIRLVSNNISILFTVIMISIPIAFLITLTIMHYTRKLIPINAPIFNYYHNLLVYNNGFQLINGVSCLDTKNNTLSEIYETDNLKISITPVYYKESKTLCLQLLIKTNYDDPTNQSMPISMRYINGNELDIQTNDNFMYTENGYFKEIEYNNVDISSELEATLFYISGNTEIHFKFGPSQLNYE